MTSFRAEKPEVNLDQAIVARAALRAADRLGLPAKTLAGIIGVSQATISRLRKGEAELLRSGKPFELAMLFIRFFRSLDALLGGDEAVARDWLNNPNMALGARPVDKIATVTGLFDAISYLDSRRAIV